MLLLNLVCLMLVIVNIKDSQNRLTCFGYAAGAFLLVCALGFAATFVLMPARGNVIDSNEVLTKIGNAVQIAAPLAAVWASLIPPSRPKA